MTYQFGHVTLSQLNSWSVNYSLGTWPRSTFHLFAPLRLMYVKRHCVGGVMKLFIFKAVDVIEIVPVSLRSAVNTFSATRGSLIYFYWIWEHISPLHNWPAWGGIKDSSVPSIKPRRIDKSLAKHRLQRNFLQGFLDQQCFFLLFLCCHIGFGYKL